MMTNQNLSNDPIFVIAITFGRVFTAKVCMLTSHTFTFTYLKSAGVRHFPSRPSNHLVVLCR